MTDVTTRALVESLCSDACAGRRAGTAGGARARAIVRDALRDAGLDPFEQPVPGCGGANVLATLPGRIDRWIVVGAHFDHLGVIAGETYRGADDNAAAVAVLARVARALAKSPPDGRGVLLAGFDGEEPPFFQTEAMGSAYQVRNPSVPLDRVDLMVAMELLGHALGPPMLPASVRETVFALGAERSRGTSARVDALSHAVPGVTVRRADATIIPPLSDHWAYWRAGVPFLLLAGTRSRRYHTPDDTPAHLDWGRIDAVAAWLERLVRDQCARPERAVEPTMQRRDDASTLDAMRAMLAPLAGALPLAKGALAEVDALRRRCDGDGALPEGERARCVELLGAIERALS